jgi:aminopeptidase N
MKIMKRILAAVFFLIPAFSYPQQKTVDVLHYKFHIGLNDVNDTIYGAADIQLRLLKPANEISLDLALANGKSKGMNFQKVEMARGAITKENKLRIMLNKNHQAGDTVRFVVHYAGIPSDGLIISKTKYGRRGFFADNWPDRGHYWLPCHEDPADKATVEFIITAPDQYQVIANGIQVEETSLGNGFKLTHWKEDTPISTKVMVIGAAEFAVQLTGFVNETIPVYSWVYPENKDNGFYDYAVAKDILPFFINNVGPYGFKKLANVQSRTKFGGLENANTIFYSEGSVTGNRRSEGTVAHEIAHQWFGNMATEKSFGHLWLSEGFATYFTILYFEKYYGKDTATAMLKEDRSQVIEYSKKSNKAIVDTLETDYMKLLNANSYQKGGWVLHMLRCQLGDSVFWKSIRQYYAKFAGSIAGTEDLQKIFEKVSGKNLQQFFQQWLYTAGQPQVEITWDYDNVNGRLMGTISQKQKEIFFFPLDLQIQLASGKTMNKTIDVSKQTVSFEMNIKEKVVRLTADPRTQLLAEITIR